MMCPKESSPMIVQESRPIPVLQGVEGWQGIPIGECGEELVSVEHLRCERIVVRPVYFLASLHGAISQTLLRESVAHRLVEAANNLPSLFKLVVLDAWRPVEVQRELYEQTQIKFRALKHTLADADPSTFAAAPSLCADSPYPHSTGGAVDITIMDDSGKFLNMGTEFDDISPAVATEYFERTPNTEEWQNEASIHCRNNRRLLFHSLHDVGFTNYKNEWWHFDYGNQFWATQCSVAAIYGMIGPSRSDHFQILQQSSPTSNTK